jgi:outer membrane protein OmpA-like peptidoglycan-associated protein
MNVRSRAALAGALLGVLALQPLAVAGDRDGVSEALESISGTWPDAMFSIDVAGAQDGEAVLNKRLEIAYEAALPGYLAYLRISSHGDLTLYRDPARGAKKSGTATYVIKPPLGSEQLIVLFASAPWDALFPHGGAVRELGGDREDAAAFAQQLTQLGADNVKLANRRYQFAVAATPGATEYTTRGIVRQVQEARRDHTASGGTARIPSRIEFEFDSDRLTSQGKLDLDVFGEALKTDLREGAVALEGHTDAVGTDEYNQALSERRAAAAKQYLVDSFGIPPARLSAVGLGKSDPIASNEDASGRSHNRRVDFIFSAPSTAAPASATH